MSNSANLNKLSVVIHNLWNMELNEYDVEKAFAIRMMFQTLEQIKNEMVVERNKRLLAMEKLQTINESDKQKVELLRKLYGL
jgi:hypothetical protein